MNTWLALDIDGTITQEHHSVPKDVVDFLRSQVEQGRHLALATGRSATFALRALSTFDFPFVLLAQHGTSALQLPEKKLLFTSYLPADALQTVQRLCPHLLAYAGFEHHDHCYWEPNAQNLSYVEDLQKREGIELKTGRPPAVALIKCFGTSQEMDRVAQELPLFHVCKIRDPFKKESFLLLITNSSKGDAVRKLVQDAHVIAAGDDANDLSLLEAADLAIAMPHAPALLKDRADLIANDGIIAALKEALKC